MHRVQRPADSDALTSTLKSVEAFYDRGQYLEAWRAGTALGPLSQWPGPEGGVMAGRLAYQLGASRLGAALHLRALRIHADSPKAVYYGINALHARRGHFAALEALAKYNAAQQSADANTLASIHTLYAQIYGSLRDFESAQKWLHSARAIDDACPWVAVCESFLRESQDDYVAALKLADTALHLRPWYRPAVEAKARYLDVLGQRAAAYELLTEAFKRIESASLGAMLLRFQLDDRRYDAAKTSIGLIERWSPLADRAYLNWLNGVKGDVAYFCGDIDTAVASYRESRIPFHQRMAERLERRTTGTRATLLPVPAVQQHHRTCAPATLAALSQYWQHQAQHLEIADSICYDGTPDREQRTWATANGFAVYEFSVTWHSAIALLDAGIPFAITTVEPDSAHLQAVVGYDERRSTFWLRDPSFSVLNEVEGEPWLEHYRAYGPRGMVLVPPNQAYRLRHIDLTDNIRYDRYYEFQSALQAHDHTTAASIAAALTRDRENHFLSLFAQRALATYDGSDVARLAALDRLLAAFPQNVGFKIERQAILGRVSGRAARLQYLLGQSAQTNVHPLFGLYSAEMLIGDGTQHSFAGKLLARCMRLLPRNAESYFQAGSLRWEQRRYAEAVKLFRIAACLELFDERYASSYFKAALWTGDQDTALQFLQRRVREYGHKSAQPARTLYQALETLNRNAEALDAIEQALAQHPNDGDLLLLAAEAFAQAAQYPRAGALLARAERVSNRHAYLHSAATIAHLRGELANALGIWRELLMLQPLHAGATRAISRLIDAVQGREKALEFLRQRVQEFPSDYSIIRIYAEWMFEGRQQDRVAALKQVLALDASDRWAKRQIALIYASRGDRAAAAAAVDELKRSAPHDSDTALCAARVYRAAGDMQQATEQYRAAIALSVDQEDAVFELIELCADIEARREVVQLLQAELARQMSFGTAFLALQRAAVGTIAHETLAPALKAAVAARPDLWQTDVAWAHALIAHGDGKAARDLLQMTAQRFAAIPRVWLELAEAAAAAGDKDTQLAALQRAHVLSPGWGFAARQLADLQQANGNLLAAKIALEQALAYAPRDALLHVWLADVRWATAHTPHSLDSLQNALRFDPWHLWAWNTLVTHAAELKLTARPLEFARALTQASPNEPGAWVLLARAQMDDRPAMEEALRKAVSVAPEHSRAREVYLDWLLDRREWRRALTVSREAAAPAPVSIVLREARAVYAIEGAPAATKLLEVALARGGAHVEAWQQLADWYRENQRRDDYLALAKRIHALNPRDPFSLGYLADALLIAGNREQEAKRYLADAIALKPDYRWALETLFRLQLDAHDLAAAEKIQRAIPAETYPAVAARTAIALAAQRTDRETAQSEFAQLCALGSATEADIETAINSIVAAGWHNELTRQFRKIVATATCSMPAAYVWGKRNLSAGPWLRHAFKLGAIMRHSHGAAAIHPLILRFADRRQRYWLRIVIAMYRDRLIQHRDVWGDVGYALTNCGLYRRAVLWMRNWREIKATPWMLLNLVISLRYLRQRTAAIAIGKHAVTLPRDHATDYHYAYLALDAGLTHDRATTDGYLNEINWRAASTYYQFIYFLADALRQAMNAPLDDDWRKKILEPLQNARRAYPGYSAHMRSTGLYYRVAWNLAGIRRRNFIAQIYEWWRLL